MARKLGESHLRHAVWEHIATAETVAEAASELAQSLLGRSAGNGGDANGDVAPALGSRLRLGTAAETGVDTEPHLDVEQQVRLKS